MKSEEICSIIMKNFLFINFFLYVNAISDGEPVLLPYFPTTEDRLEIFSIAERNSKANFSQHSNIIINERQNQDDDTRNHSKLDVIMRISSTKERFLQHSTIDELDDLHSEVIWISHPFRIGLSNLRVKALTNSLCNSQSALYERHLKNSSLWAVRMAESTQTEPVGVLGGTTYQMGNFEECIKTSAYGVKGKYCLAQFRYAPDQKNWEKYQLRVPNNNFRHLNHERSVWEELVKLGKDPVRINRQLLYWGVCMPASCTPEDLEMSLNQTLVPIFKKYNINLNVTVDPIYCHVEEKSHFSKGFFITITFMGLLLLINISSTICDLYESVQGRYKNEIDGWRELVGCFSLWRNTYNLGVYDKTTQVKFANASKFLMMLLVIYGHTLLYILGYPQSNPASLEEVYQRGADIALVNTNIVDVFFCISGFITFYYGHYPTKVGGMVYVVLSMVFRYIRLMPVFALLMAYVIFVMPHTSDGPIWNARVDVEVENCRKNWWLNVLLLNNFINNNEQCLLIGWYVTTDMLLCIIASFLVYVIVQRPKLGLFLTISVLIFSIVVTFLVTYLNNYNGLLKLFMPLLENPRKSIEFKNLYSAIYSRAGPYLVGFLGAYVTVVAQKQNFKFSKRWIVIGGISSIIIGESSQYYGIVFYQFERPFNLVENALYACLHRVLFALLSVYLLLSYLTNGFGLLDRIFNHPIFTIFGRMTYSVFLVNTLSLMTLTASIRTPIFYSYKMIMFMVFGDIVTTYVLGYMYYLYVEGPVCALSKLLQKRLAKIFAKEIENAKFNAELSNTQTRDESKFEKMNNNIV